MANQVEAAGGDLQQREFGQAPQATANVALSLYSSRLSCRCQSAGLCRSRWRMTPLNAHQGYKEALVGAVADHWRVSAKRAVVRRREYVATLANRATFTQGVASLYTQLALANAQSSYRLG
ncbi:MAG: hypothetical protein HC895_08280 [Leptolyngbyaceae cyanobacterium SM1_3_5]|nr:hypothetical protein [Leptolyngbyaceae cyanobacterium SM1_3_5]